MIVLEARSAKEGGVLNFVGQLMPRLTDLLTARGHEVRVIAGPSSSIRERLNRRLLYTKAEAILHSGNRSTYSRGRRVVVVVDRLLLPSDERPPWFSPRQELRRLLLIHALAVADAIVVPAQSMVGPLDELREKLPVPRNQEIRVIPHGRPYWDPPPSRPFHEPLRLLMVGVPYWQKNYPVVADMLRLWRKASRISPSLTITARPTDRIGVESMEELFAGCAGVNLIGRVPPEEMTRLYAEHDVLLFPSLFESFGHPMVEAMTMNMPLVVSDRDWSREICGTAAHYAHPKEPHAWLKAILGLLDGQRSNPEGLQRAKLFDWEKAASQYAEVLVDAA